MLSRTIPRPIGYSLLATAMLLFGWLAVQLSSTPESAQQALVGYRVFIVACLAVAILGPVIVTPWPEKWPDQMRRSPAKTLTAAPAGLRRVDFYIGLALVVGALLYLAQANRYTVKNYPLGSGTAFQRTDRLTGHAELWVIGVGDTQALPPDWVRFVRAE